jgi:hypothetical protein
MTVKKVTKVQSRASGETSGDTAFRTRAGCSTGRRSGSELSELEARILDCLSAADGGLTVKQLEVRVLSASGELEEALASLVEKRSLARLNTIIPSYVFRPPSDQVHSD